MSAQQQVLVVTRVALFEVVDGKTTVERGNCACAIVASTAHIPAKFSLVCYNDARETLCTAAIGSANDHSIQFQLQTNDYAVFRDDRARKWSMMFLKNAQLERFVAVLGVVFFSASGSPAHTAVIGDFGGSSNAASARVTLSNRVKVRYSAYAARPQAANGLLVLEDVLETNGDRLYNFQPTQSTMAREDALGFESHCLGMTEESTRVIAVPATIPRAGRSKFVGVDVVVFVVQLIRILDDQVPQEGAALVPVVFGVAPTSAPAPSSALVLATHAPAASSTNTAAAAATTSSDTTAATGGGVPAEQMAMIQKAAAQINTATTSTRDLHDKVLAFSDDWKQSVNRPKPSTLTNQALEQSVKQLIMENERVRDELVRRDDLIKSLDERNRDLQKRVDTAAMVAQQLMDEKNKTVSSTSDLKLEKDRIVMKLQEQITNASHERDDVHRHLQTVKKLLDVSDTELRDVKGRIDVHMVQAQSLATKLDASEDALAEERSRRKALEAKVIALQEEIRQAEADLHTKNAAVEELNRKSDSERNYQCQLIEDERQRRMFEAQQLRSEIVADLQNREAKFQADRARVADDNFKRGHEEGKQIGRNHARVDVEARMEELVLDAQRARTELDAYKTELRQANEDALAENRRLECIVLQLKKTVDEGTRTKAQNEFQLHGLRLKVRNAADALLLSMTSIAHRLTRPAAPEDLIATLTALKEGENPKLTFQQESFLAEKQQAFDRRVQWILEDTESLFVAGTEAIWNQYVGVSTDLFHEVNRSICELWLARDAQHREALLSEESSLRFTTESDSDAFFAELTRWYQSQLSDQAATLHDEQSSRDALEIVVTAEHSDFLHSLAEFMSFQMAERQQVESEESSLRQALDETSESSLQSTAGGFLTFLQKMHEEREAILSEESESRLPLESEGIESFFDSLRQLRDDEATARCALDADSLAVLGAVCEEEDAEWNTEIALPHDRKINEALIAAQEALSEEETDARQEIEQSFDATHASEIFDPFETLRAAIAAFEALMLSIQTSLSQTEGEEQQLRAAIILDEQSTFDNAVVTPAAKERSDIEDMLQAAAVRPAGGGVNRLSVAPPPSTAAAASPPAAQLDPLGFGSPSSSNAAVTATRASTSKKSAFGADSDSESDGGNKKLAPPPKRAPSASPLPKKSPTAAAAKLFADSDESDSETKAARPAPPKKSAAKKAPPKKQAKLFDSDDD